MHAECNDFFFRVLIFFRGSNISTSYWYFFIFAFMFFSRFFRPPLTKNSIVEISVFVVDDVYDPRSSQLRFHPANLWNSMNLHIRAQTDKNQYSPNCQYAGQVYACVVFQWFAVLRSCLVPSDVTIDVTNTTSPMPGPYVY